MGSTGAPYNLPWPEDNQNPDVPRDLEALALKVKDALATIDAKIANIGTGPTVTVGAIVGEVRMIGRGGTAPGWLECDGREVQQSQYGQLFAAIGQNYANGKTPAVGNFFLPDFTDAFPKGITAGDHGGANSNRLAAANMPAHTHTASHNHYSQRGVVVALAHGRRPREAASQPGCPADEPRLGRWWHVQHQQQHRRQQQLARSLGHGGDQEPDHVVQWQRVTDSAGQPTQVRRGHVPDLRRTVGEQP